MAVTSDAAQGDPPADALPRRRARARPAWRLLLAHLSPHRWMLLGGGLLGFLGGLATLAQPMVAKLAVDSLGQHRSLVGPVALLTALAVGGALLSAGGTYLLGRAAESVVLSARSGLVSQLLRLRVGALDHLKPGDLLSRVTSDTTLLRSVSTYGLVHSVNATFLLVGSVVLMAIAGRGPARGDARRARPERAGRPAGGAPDPAGHRTVAGGRRPDGLGAGAGARRAADRQGQRRRGGGDRQRRPGGPPGVAARGRGGRLDGPDGGLGRARRPGVVPGRPGGRRRPGGERSAAGVLADRLPALPVPPQRPDQHAGQRRDPAPGRARRRGPDAGAAGAAHRTTRPRRRHRAGRRRRAADRPRWRSPGCGSGTAPPRTAPGCTAASPSSSRPAG